MVQAFLSRDGTAIAYEQGGHGPAVVVVNGALSDRTASRSLVTHLESSFTVYAYDRRGRGASGDGPSGDGTGDWLDREIDDLDGLLEIIGTPVLLYGHSSGAILALEATLRGLEVERLALHEPPFILPGTRPLPPPDLARRIDALVAEGDRPGAVRVFFRDGVGLPAAAVDRLSRREDWGAACELAHTLASDATIGGQGAIPYRRLAIETPCLVLTGTASPAWMRASNEALADALPRGELRLLDGQGHAATAEAIAPELVRFFGESLVAGAAR